jgi:hypothetical protein
MEMTDGPTCGQGLAEHSALPLKLGELVRALATNLEEHLPALDGSDEDSRTEQRAYESLIGKFRAIARDLDAAAAEMAGYRDLPMGRHDMHTMSRPEVGEAFAGFVRAEEELAALLADGLERDRAMLAQMRA